MSTPNAELAYKVLDHIDAHPEQWNQSSWCGTAQCFAGWTVHLSGEDTSRYDRSGYPFGATEHKDHVSEKAARYLGFRDEEEMDQAARRVAIENDDVNDQGVPEYDFELFSGAHNRHAVGRLVRDIFGPRPGGAS